MALLDQFGNPYHLNKIENIGFTDATGMYQFNPFGFPENQQFPGSAPVENVNTIFHNMRWYLVSNFRQVLNQAYVEIGLIQTIVDVPVDDGFRGGIEIKSKQLEESQIEELQISLDRDDDLGTVAQANKWNRLFGGAGVLILTDQDPQDPLDISLINSDTPLEFRAVDMWELFWDKQNTEGYDPAIQTQDFEYYNYYGEQVHKSRVMRLKGFICPSFIRPRLRGWGFSVVEVLVRSINQYLKATDLTFEVLDEFKIDVYKIKNLVSTLMSPIGQQKVNQRLQMANYQKNFQNALVMDSEDDWDHKQLSFAGLGEAMQQIRMQVAADLRMPMTKLFGISAAGFNSGEDDIEVYNAMVESQVRNKAKYDVLRVCEIKCQKLFGYIPDDLSISFKPLRVLSAEQEENVKTQKFNRLLAARSAGELSTYEFREACNKGNLLDITLDNAGDLLNPNDPEVRQIVKEGMQNPYNPVDDINDPGADRADTRQVRAWEYGGIPKGTMKRDLGSEHKSDTVPKDSNNTKDQVPIRNPKVLTRTKPKTSNQEKIRPSGNNPKKPGSDNRPVRNFKWEEEKHPRDESGKFGTKGSSDKKIIKSKKVHIQPDKDGIYRFKTFRGKGSSGNPNDYGVAGKGEYSSPDYHVALSYAEGDPKKITEQTIELKNPLILEYGELNQLQKELYGKIVTGFDPNTSDEFDKWMRKQGYDGAVLFDLEIDKNKPQEVVKLGNKKANTIINKFINTMMPELAEEIKNNSATFEKKSYEADGGDLQMDSRRVSLFDEPLAPWIDRGIWSRCKEKSKAIFGKENKSFEVWCYQKMTGKHL